MLMKLTPGFFITSFALFFQVLSRSYSYAVIHSMFTLLDKSCCHTDVCILQEFFLNLKLIFGFVCFQTT